MHLERRGGHHGRVLGDFPQFLGKGRFQATRAGSKEGLGHGKNILQTKTSAVADGNETSVADRAADR
ncbi:hypothetical protein D3C81_1216600 [compost metagenome]